MEWLRYFDWYKTDRKILNFTYAIGLLCAALSCVTGYLLFQNGDYPSEMVNNHKWAGIITAVLCALSYWYSRNENQKMVLASTLFLALGIGITGHLGGSITHGEDFLAFGAIAEDEVTGPIYSFESPEEAEIYNDIIAPLLEAKCVSCHGSSKVKGKLRMDSPETLLAGGKSRKKILGDGVSSSEMVRRIKLRPSDDKHMPPKKKTQITEDELDFIKWWIQNGASFDAKVGDISDHQGIVEILKKMVADQGNASLGQAILSSYLPDVSISSPPAQLVNNLKKSNVVVLSAGDDSPFLEINLVNIETPSAELLSNLESLAPHITRLKLSDLALNNEQTSILLKMDNIVRLYLDGNSIGDEAMVNLKNKKHLKYLNLNNTGVTNNGLQQLDSMPSDAKIYAYNTGITLDTLINGAIVIKGGFNLDNLESDTIRISQK